MLTGFFYFLISTVLSNWLFLSEDRRGWGRRKGWSDPCDVGAITLLKVSTNLLVIYLRKRNYTWQLHRHEEALVDTNASLSLFPTLFKALRTRARIYLHLEKYDSFYFIYMKSFVGGGFQFLWVQTFKPFQSDLNHGFSSSVQDLTHRLEVRLGSTQK